MPRMSFARPIAKDRHGVQIVPGQIVAYNYSGSIALGVVDKVTLSAIYILRINQEGDLDVGQYRANPRSKVKHGTSVLAIQHVNYDLAIPTLSKTSVRPQK